MGRHAQRRSPAPLVAAVAGLAVGGVIAYSMSASGQAGVQGDQTCSFSVTSEVVSPLDCVAATTAPPTTVAPTTAPPTTVSPTPSVTPPPTSSSAPPTDWYPDASNTGIPTGLILAAYNGSHTLASGTITGKNMSGDFTVTGDVTITDSKITGSITNKQAAGTLTLADDEIIGSNTDETNSVIFGPSITARRINVHGGKANFQCQDNVNTKGKAAPSNCDIYDSFFHDPYFISPYHYDSIGSNGVDGMVVDHNTLQCKFSNGQGPGAGGCTADIGFFGDFAPIQNVTVNNNLFMASPDAGYCVATNAQKTGKAYPTGKNLTWTNNTFQRGSNGKCGYYGVVDEWQSGNGNVWSGNHWDDGTALSR